MKAVRGRGLLPDGVQELVLNLLHLHHFFRPAGDLLRQPPHVVLLLGQPVLHGVFLREHVLRLLLGPLYLRHQVGLVGPHLPQLRLRRGLELPHALEHAVLLPRGRFHLLRELRGARDRVLHVIQQRDLLRLQLLHRFVHGHVARVEALKLVAELAHAVQVTLLPLLGGHLPLANVLHLRFQGGDRRRVPLALPVPSLDLSAQPGQLGQELGVAVEAQLPRLDLEGRLQSGHVDALLLVQPGLAPQCLVQHGVLGLELGGLALARRGGERAQAAG